MRGVLVLTFDLDHHIHTDLEWKVLYVSSAEDAEQDQVLEEVMVGPVPVGVNKFVLQVSKKALTCVCVPFQTDGL